MRTAALEQPARFGTTLMLVLISYLAAGCRPPDTYLAVTASERSAVGSSTAVIQATASQESYPIAAAPEAVSVAAYPGQPSATPNAAQATIIAAKLTDAAEMALTLTAQPTSTPELTGTHEAGQLWGVPGGGPLLYVENAWYGIVDGKEVTLLAGAYPDSKQGVFFIMFPLSDHWYENIFETPTQSGAVRVVEDRNNRLKLVAKNGDAFYFDIPGLHFTASFADVVPTVTPPSPVAATQVTGYP